MLAQALAIRDQRDAGEIAAAQAAAQAPRLTAAMDELVCRRRTNAANRRLSDHLWNNRNHLFTFLREPGIDATNYRAEQAIRPAVVNRKVCGGNRTETGAEAQSILMSVLRTAKQRGAAALGFISSTLRSLPGARPSLFPDTG